ncbi:MAG: IMP dehydrogenase, partial [Planctomycetota bacterium]
MTGSTSSRSTGSQNSGGNFTPASPEGWPELLEGLTFDDVLLVPQRSDLLPREVSVDTRFSRNVPLHIPFASAAMDTVTEWRLAVSLAREGGIGIIHRNLGLEGQIREVDKVKRSANGVIEDPVTLG